jgi:hypothetical protein
VNDRGWNRAAVLRALSRACGIDVADRGHLNPFLLHHLAEQRCSAMADPDHGRAHIALIRRSAQSGSRQGSGGG